MVERSLYDVVGGQAFFDDLVERFYARVADDPVLRPVYPDDLEPGKRALALFLGQYWGGPPAYSETRGHPRLRMRHAPFVIGVAERDAWLAAMMAAVREVHPSAEVELALHDHFVGAADWMRNDPREAPPEPPAATGATG